MSQREKAVRTLARVLGMELIESGTRNPLARTYGKYCLWFEGVESGPLHTASLAEVQIFLQGKVDEFLSSRSAGR